MIKALMPHVEEKVVLRALLFLSFQANSMIEVTQYENRLQSFDKNNSDNCFQLYGSQNQIKSILADPVKF